MTKSKTKIKMAEGDNESSVIEWVSEGCTFGLCLELDIKRSSWYFKAHDNSGGDDSGTIPYDVLGMIFSCLHYEFN